MDSEDPSLLVAASPQIKRGEKKCFVKVVAIGDSGVGKTSIIQNFEHSRFSDSFKPTIGADFSNKEITIDGRIVMLQIWDTAGQERYQSLGTAFYRGADCCFLCYDITNKASLENIDNWKTSFLQKSMVVSPDTFPFMVIGNKSDLEDKRTVSADEAKRYISNLGLECEHAETSAKEGQGIEMAFKKLAQQALARQMEMQEKVVKNNSAKRALEKERLKQLGGRQLQNKNQQEKKACNC